MRRLGALALLLLLACGDARREAPAPVREAPPPTPAPIPAEPVPPPSVPSTPEALEAALDGVDDDAPDDVTTASGLASAQIVAPTAGPRCEVEQGSGVTLWPRPGAVGTAVAGDALVPAIHAASGSTEELVLLAVDAARARPIVRIPLSASGSTISTRPPVVADLGGGRAGVASIDRAGKLLYVEVSPGGGRGVERATLASDADPRFAPAVAPFGPKRAVAYVRRGSPSHVALLVLDAALRVVSTTDVTPEAAGAASPFFVRASTGTALVLVDPREGFSPIHRVPLDANAVASRGVVLRPVTGLVDPARVVASTTEADVHIAYVAHGASLATAVGYVRSGADAPQPVSLVRPTGFGGLWVDAISIPGLAVFAATAPLGREPTSPRAVHVRVATHAGLGEATTFTLPSTLAFPSLAARADGSVVLTASSSADVTSVRLRCTP